MHIVTARVKNCELGNRVGVAGGARPNAEAGERPGRSGNLTGCAGISASRAEVSPAMRSYLEARKGWQLTQTRTGRSRIEYFWKEQEGRCVACDQPLLQIAEDGCQIHHRIGRSRGGSDTADNLELLHANCHRQIYVQERRTKAAASREGRALPKSQYGQAIGYTLNHWDELRRFTEDGRPEIDNNTAERTLRLCAISRKNWLFVGSDRGGEIAAISFSILAGAKRHRIEPFAYASGLLMALSSNEVDLESL